MFRRPLALPLGALARRLSLGIFIWQPMDSNFAYSYWCALCICVRLCELMCTIFCCTCLRRPENVKSLGTGVKDYCENAVVSAWNQTLMFCKSSRNSLILSILTLTSAGTKPAASVDPWGVPTTASTQSVPKNSDPWAASQQPASNAGKTTDAWGAAKPSSASGDHFAQPGSYSFTTSSSLLVHWQ